MSEPDKVLHHESDGIQEYDNPTPGWWTWSFYAAMVFAIVYMFIYGMNFGGDYRAEYQADIIAETAAVQAYYDTHPMTPPTSELLLAGAVDRQVLGVGAAQFAKTCTPCHGAHAEGLIGPNLTDDFWIHGGRVTEIWTTIVKGVPAKGMPTWGRSFKPEVITALASYVRSLHGTNPANPKAPEGPAVQLEPLPKGAATN